MAVQFPWRANDPPSILPVIRMGPGTMVVVVPASYRTNSMMNQPNMQGSIQAPIQVPVKAPV